MACGGCLNRSCRTTKRALSRAFHSMIPGTKYRIEMPREYFEATFRRDLVN
ncbi:hypothetical protein L810_5298 [Burkholderia sp. AU4i]|nr:hypothetical protein L810_5298 [Burkholderia sp. AU4i]